MSCNLRDFIANHFNMLIDIFKDDLDELGVESIYTKCLYTSVTILYLLCGQRAIDGSLKCYVDNVKTKMEKLDNLQLKQVIQKEVTEASNRILRNNNRRMVYFMMITNAELPHAKNPKTNSKAFFPGHVFVIDKQYQKGEKVPSYKLYQSYINKYTLQEFTRKSKNNNSSNNNSFSDSNSKKSNNGSQAKLAMDYNYLDMQNFLAKLGKLLNSCVWTQEHVDFWKEFTHVSANYMKGYVIQPSIYFCYNELPAIRCQEGLLNLMNDKLKNGEIPTKYISTVERLVRGVDAMNMKKGKNIELLSIKSKNSLERGDIFKDNTASI